MSLRPKSTGSSRSFQVSDNVYQAALPPYDATKDSHCRSLMKKPHVREHLTQMRSHLDDQKRGEDRVQLFLQRPPQEFSTVLLRPQDRIVHVKHNLSKKCRAQPQFHLPRPPNTTPYLNRKERDAKQKFGRLFHFDEEKESLPSEAQGTPELTITYTKTLSQSESYHRRELNRSEQTEGKSLRARLSEAKKYLEALRVQGITRQEQEGIFREKLEAMEQEERRRILISSVKDAHIAKENEEVFPDARILSRFEKAPLGVAASAPLLLDIRWQGGTDLLLCALAFDEENRHLGTVVPKQDPLKDRSGALLVRHWDSYRFEGARVKGARRSIECLLQNAKETKLHKLVFCILNATSPGSPITGVKRVYFTVRQPTKSQSRLLSTTEFTEVLAQSVPGSGTQCSVALSAITRNDSDWEYQCLNTLYQDAISPTRLVLALKETLLMTRAMIEIMWREEAERLQKYNEYFYERLNRAVLQAKQTASFKGILDGFNHELHQLNMQEKQKRHPLRGFGTGSPLFPPASSKEGSISWWEPPSSK